MNCRCAHRSLPSKGALGALRAAWQALMGATLVEAVALLAQPGPRVLDIVLLTIVPLLNVPSATGCAAGR